MSQRDSYLLARDRFYLMGIAEDGGQIILQCLSGQPVRYCVRHDNGREKGRNSIPTLGEQFDTLAAALLYMQDKWGIVGPPHAAWTDKPTLPIRDIWGAEQAMNDEPIYIRKLSDTESLLQAGFAQYEAVYKDCSHYFDTLTGLVDFIRETLQDEPGRLRT